MKRQSNPPLHNFVEISIIDENGDMIPKKVSCNNCGALHEVTEMCVSRIIPGAEGTSAELTIEDITPFLPDSICSILETYNAELPDYEYARFMIEENLAGAWLVLTNELNEERRSGKILKYKGENRFEIEPFSRKEFFGNAGS